MEDDPYYLTTLYPRLPSYALLLDDVPWTFSGRSDANSLPNGPGTLTKEDGVRYEGRFSSGRRVGCGTLWLADHTSIRLTFTRDGDPLGPVVVTRSDGSYFEGSLGADGQLEGELESFDASNNLRFQGTYRAGRPSGPIVMFLPDGGSIMGSVDDATSRLSGDVVYTFPDGSTLEGEWQDGMMTAGRYARCGDEPSDQIFRYDPAVGERLSSDVMLEDPYQADRVEVRPSQVAPAAGDGLFARRDIEKGEIFAFYNGIRVTSAAVEARGWSENVNTMVLTDDVVLDVPQPWASASVYRATLGHKCNHSFEHNAEYDNYWHPRFGSIIAMKAVRDIAEGEELTILYGYELVNGEEPDYNAVKWEALDIPDWFKAVGREWVERKRAAAAAV